LLLRRINVQATIKHRNAQAEYYTQERCHINELSNTEADQVVSIAEARVAPGVTTRWHVLQGIVERYVIVAGQALVEVGNVPAETVGPGAVVLIPAGCRQRITNTGENDLLFLAICSPRFQQHCYQDIEHDQ
jgi:mannose-6-phosphate isomerase-like protein (cupin superfamily)